MLRRSPDPLPPHPDSDESSAKAFLMTVEGEIVQARMRSPRPDIGKTPRRGATRPQTGVVSHTNLHDVNAYLLQTCLQLRSIYVTDNPFLSRVKPGDRLNASSAFVDALSKLQRLETLSLQRSFISDECLTMLCERWRDGRFPVLCQLNVNQNLISDEGFMALADCLESMPSSIENIKVWAVNQLRPSTTATHQRLADAIESNSRIILFDLNWRSEELLSQVSAILDKRRCNNATSIQSLKSALVEIQSQTPHLKVFRLADNEALSLIWSQNIGVSDVSMMMPNEPALPEIGSIMSTLGLLARNCHLVTLELPGNGLRSSFVEFFFEAVVQGGSFRSIRHLNLERNRFTVNDIVKLVSLLDAHYAFEELVHSCALMPFESLRLAGQEELKNTNLIEMSRDLMFPKFICNHSLNDLTLDVSQEAMEELRIYLQRNEKKHRSRIAISSINLQVTSPLSTTMRRESIALKQEVSPKSDKQSNSPSPKVRFHFSPKSPLQDPVVSVDTVDDIMAIVARESPTIEDFTLCNSRFLCCLSGVDDLRFSRALVSLLAYNFQLHTIALINCGIRDPFLLALITVKGKGDFPNLVVLNFNQNSLSDDIILSLLQSPFFELQVIRLRQRSTICSPRMGTKVLKLLKKYHRRRLRVFEFDFDDARMQRQAEQILNVI